MKPTIAIYVITNLVNAKQYVGITKNLKRRWKEHLQMNGSAKALHESMKKHGEENFVFTHIADAFDKESASVLERLLIKEHNTLAPSGYNLTSGGQGAYDVSYETKEKMRNARLGKKMPESSRKKLSDSKKGIPMNLATKNKLLAVNVGKKASEQTKKKMSDAKKGKPPNSAGKPRSKETIEKQKAAIKATLAAKRAIKNAQMETT